MASVTLRAPAKVNLALDIHGRRSDGYHLLRMVVSAIDLHDTLTMTCDTVADTEVGASDIDLTCTVPGVPTDATNSVVKALMALSVTCGVRLRARVHLDKRIPISAGLGGESTDAATALLAANQLFNLGLDKHHLADIGARIGADVPFFMWGGAALVEGVGEKVTPIETPFPGWTFALVKPSVSISTAEVYRRFRSIDCVYPRPDVDEFLRWFESSHDPLAGTPGAGLFANSLEAVTAEAFPIIKQIKEKLMVLGAVGSVMTGHGPTVVGIFEDDGAPSDEELSKQFSGCWTYRAKPLPCE